MPIQRLSDAERDALDDIGEEDQPSNQPARETRIVQVDVAPENPRYQFERGPVKPRIGEAEAAARGALSGFTMDFGDEIYGGAKGLVTGGDPYEEIAYQQYLKKHAAEQNPYSYGTGQFAGAAGLALLTRGLGPQAGLAARTGYGAVQGALTGAGEGENLQERIDKAQSGAVLGGLVGGVAEPLMRGAISAVTPSSLRTKASERAVKTVAGGQIKAARDLAPDYEAIGQRLLTPTDELGGKAVVQFGANAAETARRAKQASDVVGDKMGMAIKAIDDVLSGAHPMNKERLQQSLAQIKSKLPKAEGRIGSEDKKYIDDLIEQISKVESLEDLATIRKLIVYNSNTDPRTLLGTQQAVRGAINEEIKQSVKQGAGLIGQGFESEKALMESYPELVQKYRAFRPAATYGEEAALREFKNRDLGLSSNVLAGSVGSGAMASGQGIPMAGLKGIIVGLANQIGLERGNSAAAVSLQKAANILDKSPQFMKQFGNILMEASKKGATNLLIAHQALMNQNPEYRKYLELEP